MATFHLQIVTPDGLHFDGQAEKLSIRTVTGDLGILARHIDYVTALGMGEARVTLPEGKERRAACIGGMLSVTNGEVKVVATTFEWAEDIDLARASAAETKARAAMAQKSAEPKDIQLAEARLKRALIRQSVARNGK